MFQKPVAFLPVYRKCQKKSCQTLWSYFSCFWCFSHWLVGAKSGDAWCWWCSDGSWCWRSADGREGSGADGAVVLGAVHQLLAQFSSEGDGDLNGFLVSRDRGRNREASLALCLLHLQQSICFIQRSRSAMQQRKSEAGGRWLDGIPPSSPLLDPLHWTLYWEKCMFPSLFDCTYYTDIKIWLDGIPPPLTRFEPELEIIKSVSFFTLRCLKAILKTENDFRLIPLCWVKLGTWR